MMLGRGSGGSDGWGLVSRALLQRSALLQPRSRYRNDLPVVRSCLFDEPVLIPILIAIELVTTRGSLLMRHRPKSTLEVAQHPCVGRSRRQTKAAGQG